MDAHLFAHAFNLGNGQGFSVRQVLQPVARVTGREVPHALTAKERWDALSRQVDELMGN